MSDCLSEDSDVGGVSTEHETLRIAEAIPQIAPIGIFNTTSSFNGGEALLVRARTILNYGTKTAGSSL